MIGQWNSCVKGTRYEEGCRAAERFPMSDNIGLDGCGAVSRLVASSMAFSIELLA